MGKMPQRSQNIKQLFWICFTAIALLTVFFFAASRTRIPSVEAKLTRSINTQYSAIELSAEDSDALRKILSNRFIPPLWYTGYLACMFSETAICFDDQMFYVGADNCANVMFNDRYFSISSTEQAVIDSIMRKYGISLRGY